MASSSWPGVCARGSGRNPENSRPETVPPQPVIDRRLRSNGRYLGLLVAASVLAVVLRVVYVLSVASGPLEPPSDAYYFSLIAENLVAGHGYVELKAHAYRPPGYPWFLAGVYAVAGVRQDLARLALCAVGGLHCALFGMWAGMLGSRRIGALAAFMAAVYPPLIRFPETLFSETFYVFMLALSLTILLAARERTRLSLWGVAGLTFGLTALTREMTLLMPAVLAVWLVLDRSLTWRQSAWMLGVFAIAMALAVAPWTVRNYRVLGGLAPISTNTGINFYIGNNPTAATHGYPWRMAPGVDWDRGGNELIAHRRGLAEGMRYKTEYPRDAAINVVRKAWQLWRPPIYGYEGLGGSARLMRMLWLLSYLGAAALAVYGIVKAAHDWRRLSLPALMLAVFSLPYVVAYPDTRYRLPMETLLLFYSALGLAQLVEAGEPRR